MCVSKTPVICHPWPLARSRYTCGSSEASITIASLPAPMRYERQPLPVLRTLIILTSLACTCTSAVFQARLHAFIPPSREHTSTPRAASCSAAMRLVLPAAHTVTTGSSLGTSTSARAAGSCAFRASYASTWILPGMAHSARSAVGRTSRIVTGRPSSSQARRVSTEMVFIRPAPFRLRPAAPTLASQAALLQVGTRGIHAHAKSLQPRLQIHSRDRDSRPRSPCLQEALRGGLPAPSPEWSEREGDVQQYIPVRDAHPGG